MSIKSGPASLKFYRLSKSRIQIFKNHKFQIFNKFKTFDFREYGRHFRNLKIYVPTFQNPEFQEFKFQNYISVYSGYHDNYTYSPGHCFSFGYASDLAIRVQDLTCLPAYHANNSTNFSIVYPGYHGISPAVVVFF